MPCSLRRLGRRVPAGGRSVRPAGSTPVVVPSPVIDRPPPPTGRPASWWSWSSRSSWVTGGPAVTMAFAARRATVGFLSRSAWFSAARRSGVAPSATTRRSSRHVIRPVRYPPLGRRRRGGGPARPCGWPVPVPAASGVAALTRLRSAMTSAATVRPVAARASWATSHACRYSASTSPDLTGGEVTGGPVPLRRVHGTARSSRLAVMACLPSVAGRPAG